MVHEKKSPRYDVLISPLSIWRKLRNKRRVPYVDFKTMANKYFTFQDSGH